MIIVFFHVLYLIGKMMYDNYHSVKRKESDQDDKESPMPANFPKNKRFATDPFADDVDKYDEDVKTPRFFPPAYIQRYVAVQEVLADPQYRGKIKKVVDFGCSELGFLNHLKNTAGIEEILCVDVDRQTLENHKIKAIPLNADYLQNRANPLSIHVYEGSVTHRDKKLANSDAVVAIELIEHLYPDTLMDFPYNVFGYIEPLVAVITTPNADFNVLFPLRGNELRHWDHKFEWTRQQFEDWANNIVSRYPAYQVSFQGIGAGPAGTEHLGSCSQMAIFSRIHETESVPICGIEGLLKSVTSQEFPFRFDNRSDEQKILDEASYIIRRFTMNNVECLEEYSLKSLLEHLQKFYISEEALREILETGGYTIVDREEGAVIMCPAMSTFSDYDDELANAENYIDGGNWESDYIRENSPYQENFGTWEESNIESAYDECWDIEYEIPAPNNHTNETIHDSIEPVNNIVLETELLVTRSLDSADFNSIEISNVSHVPSTFESIEPNILPPFLESSECFEENSVNIPSNISSTENPSFNQNENQNPSVECKTEAVTSSTKESSVSLSQIEDRSSLIEGKNLQEFPVRPDDTIELESLCSIYLESSCNEDREVCPDNITNPSFDCESLVCSFEKSRRLEHEESAGNFYDDAELQIQKRLSTASVVSNDLKTQPQFTSSPRVSLEFRENREGQKCSKSENFAEGLKSVSQTSLHSNGNISTPTTTSSDSSFSTIRKFYPLEENSMFKNLDTVKLKGGNEMADEINSESGEVSSSESFMANNAQEQLDLTRIARQRAPESLELRSTTSSNDAKQSLSTICSTLTSSTCSTKSLRENAQANNHSAKLQINSCIKAIVDAVDENSASTRKINTGKIEQHNRWKLPETSETVEAKSATPDAPETPPNSWSPEIMDSGYPNSSSTQDMTPEYDLSSISQDRISDSESPSIAEAPRLGFIDHVDVENGDLANNNRDDEGNNMIAENENDLEEDLQPLIDVLEDDLENENDIYAVENDFPVWLLRILERGNNAGRQAIAEQIDLDEEIGADDHAAGDGGIPDDEGFDSTSSEDDNSDEISTESSEETIDWNASGDY